jgi:hypothetical protein
MTTRFDSWSPQQCMMALLLLIVTLTASLLVSAGKAEKRHVEPTVVSSQLPATSVVTTAAAPVADEAMSDVKVYQRIVKAVASGEGYYDVVTREHRLHNYPLKPYFTIRPPTLAWLSAALGPMGIRLAMFALIGLVAMTWLEALRGINGSQLVQYAAFGLLAESAFVLSLDPFMHFHDSWAALLIALSLALRRPDRCGLSIAAGLAAVLFRELALPYLLLMAVLAAYDKCWREAYGWGAAIAVALVAQVLHASAVAALVTAADPASQGWSGLGGWSFFLTAAHTSSLLELLPMGVTAIVVPFSLFGWIAWHSGLALRVTGLMLGYAMLLSIFARPDNIYWAILIEPYLLAGISLGVAGVWRLWQGSGFALNRQLAAQ